ncbi:nitronate monooxygenase [Halobacteriovorax sp. JY17]|uniref:NAD(P)H-dependent flavin oxidoreductase n=1 Tax=Halobacteriovorax sp. JY17 TaxID=2014617 RepID=UPI000C5671B6|nr:nitronate monooxygenase [Halobacteriovorax sp. JY17]PIK15698.1 MAG: nitronate monooxygenase [Halobacteriovorax sp. JY17]
MSNSPFKNKIVTDLFNIQFPIIQAGMVWVSGAKLAAAAANAGCLGIIGAGSMRPDLLREHLKKAKSLTDKPLAVNIPLLYKYAEEHINTSLENGIRIFFTSAGSPKKYTQLLKEKGCTVVHVTSSPELAIKCEQAGVDAIVAEGFEAGGHNGRDEITTMSLIPQVVQAVTIPVIAAGGIASGQSILAAMALGADGVQIGSRFACTQESSAHLNFKNAIIAAKSGDTSLSMKEVVPVRLLKNSFYQSVLELERKCAGKEALVKLLGKGRAKLGMLDGDMNEGELEIGQVSALIKDIPSVSDLVDTLIREYRETLSTF